MATTGPDPLDLLSVTELARLWSVHPKTIRRWIREGRLRTVPLGTRRIRITRAAAERFVADGELQAEGRP